MIPHFVLDDLPRGSRKDPNRDTTAFVNKMIAVRLALGYTQEQFAHFIGITGSGLSMMERGDRKPQTSTVFEILTACGVEPTSAIAAIALRSPTQPEYFSSPRETSLPKYWLQVL